MISIKNFVNTNIEILRQSDAFRGFRTTVYFTAGTVNNPDVEGENFATLRSVVDFDNKVAASAAVRQSVNEYFRNGGTSLCLITPTDFTLEGFKADMYAIAKVVEDYYFICLGDSVTMKTAGYPQSQVFAIADFCSGNGWSDTDLKSLNRIRLCLTTDTETFVVDNNLLNTKTAVKYSTLVNSGDLVDAALLIGAFFSQVDVTQNGAIQDYNFHTEFLGEEWFEDINQETFNLLTNNKTNGSYNLIGKVANRILNIGGDFVNPDGVSISLDFGVSCIERDLDYAMIERLFGKLPLTQEGQSRLVDAIKTQLNKYVDNGFLETDATYMGDTHKINYNGKQYTVVENGTIMPLGYRVFFVPINAISVADKSAKRFPYMFVAMQSVHGARVIQVNGSII